MNRPIEQESRHCKSMRRSAEHKGEPCKNWAVPGSDFCKFHGGGAVGKKTGKGRPKGCKKPEGAGGPPPKGNQNARKHGAYSMHLLPEEQVAYDRLTKEFAESLGETDVFDRRLVHQLAMLSVKVDSAVSSGAPAEAVAPFVRLVMEHMRELKATRASKDSSGLTGNTPAEVMAALFMKVTGGSKTGPAPAVIDVTTSKIEALPPGAPEESSESCD